MAVLTPAYSRDYKTAQECEDDFRAGKDFIFHDPSSRWDGKPCSIRDFKTGEVIELRYKKGPSGQTTKGIAVKINGGK